MHQLLGVALPLGAYLARVFSGEAKLAQTLLGPLERGLYRTAGVDPRQEMTWTRYAAAVVLFNLFGTLLLYTLQRLQNHLPLNPAGLGAVPPTLAFNTAVSFVTNTNWQAYAGETTQGHLVQMAGLGVQNFVSAAVGMAVAIAFVRGLARRDTSELGNFWVDLVRGSLRILLPLAVLSALLLVAGGVIQNFHLHDQVVTTVTGATQTLPGGPVASQEAVTHYQVLRRSGDRALLSVRPETGRMHQIRIHLSLLNASITGDELYGGKPFYLSSVKRGFNLKKHTEEEPFMKRMALHAKSLEFSNLKHESILIDAPYPKDFQALVRQLELNS